MSCLHDVAVISLTFMLISLNDLYSLNQLPDGRVIKVGTERFQAPEALFTPVGTWYLFLLFTIIVLSL